MKPEVFDAVVSFAEQGGAFDRRSLRADRIVRADSDPERGGQVREQCGAAIAGRTFIAYTTRTDLLPSASLSQGVYFVSRVGGTFVVWEQVH